MKGGDDDPCAKETKGIPMTKPRKYTPLAPGEVRRPADYGYGPLAEWAGRFCQEWEVFAHMLFRYAEKVIVPRRLAAERRQAGDPSASPNDYACGCPLCPKDFLPRCFAHKPHCRFRHRLEQPPFICNDPVRHAACREEYSKLKDELCHGPEEETSARLTQIIEWYDRRVLNRR